MANERRIKPNKDIGPNGMYVDVNGQEYFDGLAGGRPEDYFSKDVLDIVANSNGRLRFSTYSVCDDEDEFTHSRVVAIERRAKTLDDNFDERFGGFKRDLIDLKREASA